MSEKTTKRLILDTEDAAVSLVGRTLSGRYVLESILGQGGMGTVYAARHQVIGRAYAIKVLRGEIASDHDTVLRFIQEAKIAGGLRHPNVVEVLDFGEVPATPPSRFAAPFMVMPLLEGRTMANIIDADGPLDGARAARLFAQAADGLAAAHDKGIVHRDLKPDNLFVIPSGDGELVKVLDFGVAKLLTAPKLTKHGTVFGTPYYMSPEQAGGREVDPRTDQYALGVVMYEVLSGRVPFDDETPLGVMTKHLFATPEPLEVVVRDHARLGRMGPIVRRCLEKRRENRFADMRALGEALRAAENGAANVGASGSLRGPSAQPLTTPRGTVRLADAPPRALARTELDMSAPNHAARPPSRSNGAVLAMIGVAAVVVAGGAFVGYRSLLNRPTHGSAAASGPPSAVASTSHAPAATDTQAPPSATAPSSAGSGAGGTAAPPPAGSPGSTSAASLNSPARTAPPRVPVTPNASVPTATSKIDHNVW